MANHSYDRDIANVDIDVQHDSPVSLSRRHLYVHVCYPYRASASEGIQRVGNSLWGSIASIGVCRS
jgi:hypothetical protein